VSSVARDHNEWLSLVPTSGPFLSLETLLRVFPQGLPARDADTARLLRLAWEEWEAEGEKRHPDPAIHTAWVRWVLTTLLRQPPDALAEGQRIPEGIKAEKPEYGVTLRPNLVLTTLDADADELTLELDEASMAGEAAPAAAVPLLLLQVYGRGQGLEKPAKTGDAWVASPATRMQELLAQTPVKIGLVTNGEDWMLVQRATDTTGFAQFSVPIWLEEPVTLRAFGALLGPERFYGQPDQTLLQLLVDSADDHQEVTDQLGYQVRRAVEMLVQALDEIDRNRSGELLNGISESALYEGALTLMMRLVFLLCAEERGMFPVDEEVYSRNYAVSTLMASLREAADAHGEEILERRSDAWSRLLATFRAIWQGVEHEAMRLPAYGGGLLDPNRFPWMDSAGGTSPLPLHNRTVLHLLEALQILRVKLPGGGPAETRRLSFRALDIEQIGHVYEGLLDHTAVRATEPMLGLIGTKEREPEVALAELERLAQKSRKELLAFLKEATGRSDKALQTALDNPVANEGRLLAACEGDTTLIARVRPWASLVRRDDFDRYVVIPSGHVFVTSGDTRRATGTHYTPRSLTEPIVRRALEPLVYRGMAQGVDPSPDTLRSAEDILGLKVCDMACGSGAFLVEACRYLGDRLCEAWEIAEKANPDALLTTPVGLPATGDPAERLVPGKDDSPEERRILARRLVASRCLYGVDKNPQAVDIAKLSLWLVTMDRDKPFHFLDHAIKGGDSLVGCTIAQIRTWSLDGKSDSQALDLFSNRAFDEAIGLRRELEQLPSDRIEFIERKARLYRAFETKMTRARLAADLVIAPVLMDAKPKAQETKRRAFQGHFVAFPNEEGDARLRAEADVLLGEVKPFHWPLEFPDVFDTGGFDVIIGNPPFMGGKKITGELGVPYREHLVAHLGRGQKGSADIAAYFFLRALELLKDNGCFGLIATNTIAQGDTREVGLDQIIGDGASLYHALPSMKWPGKANLEVAVAHTYKGVWGGKRTLSERDVQQISAFLDDGTASGKPFRLAANAGKGYIGCFTRGIGFVVEPEQARELIARNPGNADALFPYLNGEDLNSRPDQSPSRWVINFRDWPLGRLGQSLPVSGETLQHIADTIEINLSDDWRPKVGSRWESTEQERRDKWLRIGVVPSDYPGPVAADYPDCLAIVEEIVKPERVALPPTNSVNISHRQRWWLFGNSRPELHAAITDLPRVLAIPLMSSHVNIEFQPRDITFSHMLGIVADASSAMFAILQSTYHGDWMRLQGSTLGKGLRYTPSDCFETFPFPVNGFGVIPESVRADLDRIGEAYHEHRCAVCMTRKLGLTKVYNLFHAPTCHDADIAELRRLHAAMDTAVAAAYGWDNLALRHDFYGDGKETRYTLHPDAKGDVLRRLLALNHERHAEQEAESEDILPTLETEEKGVRARLTRGKAAPFDPSGSLFSAQTMLREAEGSGEDDPTLPPLDSSSAPPPLTEMETLERAALLATYLVMRAVAPEKLARLRHFPARPRQGLSARKYHRVRLLKHVYFAQEMVQAGRRGAQKLPGLTFRRHKKGLYTEQIDQAEQVAVREGWLVLGEPERADDELTIRYELGPKAEAGVKRALELLGEDEPRLDQKLAPLDDLKTRRSEQWTTVHKSWSDLRARDGKEPTTLQVQEDVQTWKPGRFAFSPRETMLMLEELRLSGLLRK